MRVAHLNKYTYGGSAIVAKRIHHALLNIKVDSLLVTKFGIRGDALKHFYYQDARLRYFLRSKMATPILFPLSRFIQNVRPHSNLAGKPSGFETFSIPGTDGIQNFNVLEDREVINLHYINDFIVQNSFFKKFSSKKFIWTLHDMNPITGGCHHSDGCLKFESSCLQCPQLKNTIDEDYSKTVQEIKIKALEHLSDHQMIIVSPSLWLSNLSQKSKITKRFKHFVIPNPSFTKSNSLSDRSETRKRLGLPVWKKIVMFASENLNNPRKGIDLLFRAVRLIPKNREILLVGIGHKAGPQPGIEIFYTGSLSNVDLLASYFYSADVFVTPTVAENSPLVVIESLCCGTPVVGSDVGGIPDLVSDDNGILFPVGDSLALAKAIQDALFERQFDRETIQRNAEMIHNPINVASEYLRLYKSF